MNLKIAIPVLLVTSVAAVTTSQILYYHRLLYKRFPEVDRKIIREAYYNMLKDAVSGRLPSDFNDMSDVQMDELFLKYVDYLQN